MWEQLKAYQDKEIVLGLANGTTVAGKVLEVERQLVRLETGKGTVAIPASAVQIIMEPAERSLTQEQMDQIAKQMKDSMDANLACYPTFYCPGAYSCMPPHSCFPNFGCAPGRFSQAGLPPGCFTGYQCAGTFVGAQCTPPGFYAGGPGGGYGEPGLAPPYCGPYQFHQPCGAYQFHQPCSPYQFHQPCGPYQFGQVCGPSQFYQPCGPYQFNQACVHYPFSGAQCFPPRFACPNVQFYGKPIKPHVKAAGEPAQGDESKGSQEE